MPSWLAPGAWVAGLHGIAEAGLDAAVRRAVTEPMAVHTAEDVRASVQGPMSTGMAAFVIPALSRLSGRFSKRVLHLGSRLSFSMQTLLTAFPPVATSVTLGIRELHALASLVVNRLRAEGLEVDRRFVQRVTVNVYVWPGGGRALEQAHAPALMRVAGLWATRPLASERAGEWAGRAADAIVDAELRAGLARYRGDPPALEA